MLENENYLHREDDRQKIFREHFPSGILVPLSPDDNIDAIKRYFKAEEVKSSKPEYFGVYHSDDTASYGIIWKSEQEDGSNLGWALELFDKNRMGIVTGRGMASVTMVGENSDEERPRVEGTYTFKPFKRKGLGIRRYRMMNALTLAYLSDTPLHSDWPSPSATAVWGKLVETGEAESVEEGDFRFLKKTRQTKQIETNNALIPLWKDQSHR